MAIRLSDVGEVGDAIQIDQVFGEASRSFISGMRLCPPARIFASDPCFLRSAIGSERLFGEKYSKGTGIMTYPSM
jgi:hypothetical protein